MKVKNFFFLLIVILCCSFLFSLHEYFSVGKEFVFAQMRQEYIVPTECKSYLPSSVFFYGKNHFPTEYLSFVMKQKSKGGSFIYLLNQNSRNAMQRTQTLPGETNLNDFVVSKVFDSAFQDSVTLWCKGKIGEEVCFFATSKYSGQAPDFAARIDSVTYFLKCFMR